MSDILTGEQFKDSEKSAKWEALKKKHSILKRTEKAIETSTSIKLEELDLDKLDAGITDLKRGNILGAIKNITESAGGSEGLKVILASTGIGTGLLVVYKYRWPILIIGGLFAFMFLLPPLLFARLASEDPTKAAQIIAELGTEIGAVATSEECSSSIGALVEEIAPFSEGELEARQGFQCSLYLVNVYPSLTGRLVELNTE